MSKWMVWVFLTVRCFWVFIVDLGYRNLVWLLDLRCDKELKVTLVTGSDSVTLSLEIVAT
jgi:hypothetical protein